VQRRGSVPIDRTVGYTIVPLGALCMSGSEEVEEVSRSATAWLEDCLGWCCTVDDGGTEAGEAFVEIDVGIVL
jgi:hypothetical protein